MSALSFATLPGWAMGLSLAAHLAVGIALGGMHFGGLWWNTRLFSEGGRAATAVAVMVGRIVLLGGVLTLVSFEGAAPLLATALGVLLARPLVTRRVRKSLA